jgi:hypothetical protein
VLRYGEAPDEVGEDRLVGSRLWLYTNFDCNLSCDYYCVRSLPRSIEAGAWHRAGAKDRDRGPSLVLARFS